MGFLRKILGGGADQTAPRAPRRAEPETIDAVEVVWKSMQDLVDEINKNGPSGSLTGTPLQLRIRLRDEITVIGERLGTTRAKVKARPSQFTTQTVGVLCGALATQAADDPFCAQPLDPATEQPSIATRCADYAAEVQRLEREVEHDRRLEHDRRKL